MTLSFSGLMGYSAPKASGMPSNALFGKQVKTIQSASMLTAWQSILQQYRTEYPYYQTCRVDQDHCNWPEIAGWQAFLSAIQNDSPMRQIIKVNNWVNSHSYRLDSYAHNVEDHWSGVREFLQASGDCEDFAITKYFSLRQLGIPAHAMRIAVVKNRYTLLDHAVLTIDLNGSRYILDNEHRRVLTEYQAGNFKPYYAFNEVTYWSY